MKTIKDIMTRKNKYTDIVDENGGIVLKGRETGINRVSSRTTLGTEWIGGVLEVNVEKYQMEVCSYSKIRQYRRLEGGYRPVMTTFYTYTYSDGENRLRSKDFRTLKDLLNDVKEKTSKVEMGATTMEVSITE